MTGKRGDFSSLFEAISDLAKKAGNEFAGLLGWFCITAI
jgi:hypothetical protein